MSYGPPPEPDKPRVWDLSDNRTEKEREDETRMIKAAKAASKQNSGYLIGSPFLTFSLFIALLAYFINDGNWMKTAEGFFSGRGKAVAAKPFITWARHHPLSYEEVTIAIDAVTGKPVIWDIVRSPAGNYFQGSDGSKPVSWVMKNDSVEAALDSGEAVEILARIDGEKERSILLMFIRLMQP